jgi:cis-3-alkyl-4-acyloxetan-2-one decarboxylase
MEVIQVQGVDVYLEGKGSEVVLMLHGWPDTWSATKLSIKAAMDRWIQGCS